MYTCIVIVLSICKEKRTECRLLGGKYAAGTAVSDDSTVNNWQQRPLQAKPPKLASGYTTIYVYIIFCMRLTRNMCALCAFTYIMRAVIGYNNHLILLLLLLLYGREDTVTITTPKRRVKCSRRVRTLYCIMYTRRVAD